MMKNILILFFFCLLLGSGIANLRSQIVPSTDPYFPGSFTLNDFVGTDFSIYTGPCLATEIVDCAGNCVDLVTAMSWIGDTFCDDGAFGMDLTCAFFSYDSADGTCAGSDCQPGAIDNNLITGPNGAWTSDGCTECVATSITGQSGFGYPANLGYPFNNLFVSDGQIACDFACGTVTVTTIIDPNSLAGCLGWTGSPVLPNVDVMAWLFPPTGTFAYTITPGGAGTCDAAGTAPVLTSTGTCPIMFTTTPTAPTAPTNGVDGCPPTAPIAGTDGNVTWTAIMAPTLYPGCWSGPDTDMAVWAAAPGCPGVCVLPTPIACAGATITIDNLFIPVGACGNNDFIDDGLLDPGIEVGLVIDGVCYDLDLSIGGGVSIPVGATFTVADPALFSIVVDSWENDCITDTDCEYNGGAFCLGVDDAFSTSTFTGADFIEGTGTLSINGGCLILEYTATCPPPAGGSTIAITDPCSCINNAATNGGVGQFSEGITIFSAAAGEIWTIVSVSGLYATQDLGGLLVTDLDIVDNGDGTYSIAGFHDDAIGYSLVVQNTGSLQQLGISNTCNYPEASIVGIPQNLCTTPLDIYALEGTPFGGVFNIYDATLTLIEAGATILDPTAYLPGDFILLEYIYTNPGGCDAYAYQSVYFYNCCADFSITDFTPAVTEICENDLISNVEITATNNLIGADIGLYLFTEADFIANFSAGTLFGAGTLLGTATIEDVAGAAQAFLADVDLAQDIAGCDPVAYVLVAAIDPATYPVGLPIPPDCIIVAQTNITVWPDLTDVTITLSTFNCVTTLTPSCGSVTLSTYAISKDPGDAASMVDVTVSQSGNSCSAIVSVAVPACAICPDPEFMNVQNAVCASDPNYVISLSEVVPGGGFVLEGPGAEDPSVTGVIMDNGDGTLTVSPTTAQNDYLGVYTITYTAPVVAGSGCAPVNISDSFTIHGSYDACFNAPPALICLGTGDTYVATANDGPTDGSTHVWTLNGVEVDWDNVYTFTPTVAGAFTLEHTVGVDLCQTQCAVTINVVDGSAIGGTGFLPDNVVCQGTNSCLADLTLYLNPGPSLNGGTFQLEWNRPMINEVEYSNVTSPTDVNTNRDWIEIAGMAGTDLSDYLIVLYEAKQHVTDNIGEGNGRVYAVLSPELGYGWYVDYNDETGRPIPMMPDTNEYCDNCMIPDLEHGCGNPLRYDVSPNQWCTSPDILRPLDDDCDECDLPGRWDSDVFPLSFLNDGITTASTIIPAQLDAANGVDYGALAIVLGAGRNLCTTGPNTHGGDIQAGPAGIALVYIGTDGLMGGGFDESTPQEEFMLPLYGDYDGFQSTGTSLVPTEANGPSACEFDYQVIQFIGYGTCFSATQPHDPANPIANGDSNPYFGANDVNTPGNDYNINDPADEPWFGDDFNGNASDHGGLYTNKGIFSACNGPARGLITTDINVCDVSSTSTVQFTNDCWVIPNVTDAEINYPVCPSATSEYSTPGWLNWGQLDNEDTGYSGCDGSSAEEFYYDYIAPNGDILNMCNLCPSLFVGGLVVQEDELFTYGPGSGGDMDSDLETDILFDFTKNQVYPVCFNYTFPGSPEASACASEGVDNELCIYIMSKEQNYWEGPRFLCEGMSTPVNLNTLLMDSIQFVGPHLLYGSVEAEITETFTENMKAPMITEINYIYHDIEDDLGGGDVTTDNHCITYNYVPSTVGQPDNTNDYEARYICEGIEISAEYGTELSCYALIFYHNSTVYGNEGPANGAGIDVIYLGADGLLHATNINEGIYMQLYGTVDTDCNDDPDRHLFTVPGQLDWGTTTFTDEGVTQVIPNAQSFADLNMSAFFGTPWYYGATPTGNTNNYGNNFGGVNANMPAVGGLFWDINNNHAYDYFDVRADALDFPWERQSECSNQCGVGSRWFPIADVPGGSPSEIGGVGIMNTCTGELLDFISWGSEIALCNVAYEDDSYGGPFEQLISTPIDTTQSSFSTDDLRTLQLWSCSVLPQGIASQSCVADKCANDGGIWVMVWDGGHATIPGCDIEVAQFQGNTEFSNTLGSYNCTLSPDAVKCVAPDMLNLPLGDLAQLVEDGGTYNITELDMDLPANTGTIPNNYIVTDHEIEVIIQGAAGHKVIRYTVGSDLCSITGRPTEFDTWFNTNDINEFWEDDVEPMDYTELNPWLQGSYQTPPTFEYNPLDYYISTINQGYIGTTADAPYDNVACEENNEFITQNYGNHCLNGEFWGAGNPNFSNPTFYPPHSLVFGYDNGYQVYPAAGAANNLNDGGCYEGYCTSLAQTNYWVNDLCAYMFSGNRRIPADNPEPMDTCYILDRTPQTYTVTIKVRMDYRQCFPIGDFFGPGVTVNMDNMDDPFWQLDPTGLSDESPLEITYNASNFNDLDTDEATDDVDCSNPSTQLVPVNFSYPADLIDDITVCSTDEIILVTLLAPGTPANGEFTCIGCPPGSLPSNFFFDPSASGPGAFTLHYATNIGTECYTEDDIVIHVLGGLTVIADCNDDSYDISVSGIAPGANLTGVWVDGVNYGPGPTITVDAPAVTTDVTVTYDFDGCHVDEVVTLYPAVALSAVQIGCTDGLVGGSLNLIVNGGAGSIASGAYDYSVNGGAFADLTSPVISGVAAGLNTICVRNTVSGCEDCFDITVAPVTPNPSVVVGSVCVGESVLLQATHPNATATFTWFLNGGQVVGTNSFITIPNIQSSVTYYVNATVGTCQSQLVPVVVSPVMPVDIVSSSVSCIPNTNTALVTVMLAGGGPYTTNGTGVFNGNTYTQVVVNGTYSISFNTAAAEIAGCDGVSVPLTVECALPPIEADPDDLGEHTAGDIVIFNSGNITPNDSGVNFYVVDVYECDGVSYTTQGTITDNGNGSWTYTPPTETFTGNDTVCYTIEDQYGQQDDTYVIISYVDIVDCNFTLSVTVDCSDDNAFFDLVINIVGAPNAVYEFDFESGDPLQYHADGTGLLALILGPFESDGDNGYNLQVSSLTGDCSQSSSQDPVECIKTAIELLTFDGEVLSEGNLLSWTTSSENENDYFTLERSKDGITGWFTVATVDGAGSSTVARDYAKLDKNAPNGSTYYRLKETDFSGVTRVASNVIMLTRGVQSYSFNNVFPVPSSHLVNVIFSSVKETSLQAKLYDLTGKLIVTKDIKTKVGSNQFSLDIRGLATGSYFLTLSDGEVTINTKIIKD